MFGKIWTIKMGYNYFPSTRNIKFKKTIKSWGTLYTPTMRPSDASTFPPIIILVANFD